MEETFQSAPRSEDRGDQIFAKVEHRDPCFNPRPDPRTGATCLGKYPLATMPRFQSAPRSEDRGDAWRGWARRG